MEESAGDLTWMQRLNEADEPFVLVTIHNNTPFGFKRLKQRDYLSNSQWKREPPESIESNVLSSFAISCLERDKSFQGEVTYELECHLPQSNTENAAITFRFGVDEDECSFVNNYGGVSVFRGMNKERRDKMVVAFSVHSKIFYVSRQDNEVNASTGSVDQMEIPLIVFVNSKSGGKQGKWLISKFQSIIPKEQVFDILEGGPRQGLEKYKNVPNLRVLACGGDGTGRWILETLDKMEFQNNEKPPVAILPLGTGNDIARVLGWGGGYNDRDNLNTIVDRVLNADTTFLDRWQIAIQPEGKPEEITVMNNYLSIGFADAQIALNFHNMRENNPGLFFHRGINKFWYLTLGLNAMLSDLVSDVTRMGDIVEITVDNEKLSIPDDLEGIVVLNLPSYAGGMNLWGTIKDQKFEPVSFSDRKLEVIGIRSPLHLGEIGAGLGHGVRLAQGKEITIFFKPNSPPLPCKIDGEPWLQKDPVVYHITFFNQAKMLCKADSVASRGAGEKSGWLVKQGYKVPTWRTRWFVLKDGKLYYYATTQDKKPKGVIDLSQCTVCMTKGKTNAFELRSNGSRTYYINTGDTKEDAEEWIDACVAGGARLAE